MYTSFDEQESFNHHPSSTEFITDCPRIWHDDDAIDCTTDRLSDLSQISPDNAYISPLDDFLDLSGMCGLKSVWSADLLVCPYATSTPNHWQDVTHSFRSCPPFNTVKNPSPLPVPHFATVRVESTPTRVRETVVPYFVPHSHSVQNQIGRSANRPISTFPMVTQSTASRHTPGAYPLGQNSALSSSFYLCQWSDNASPCGAVIKGTKNAIGQHLQSAHAIRLKADKTDQACLWDKCQKKMRGDCIIRHILAVHIKNKVHCASCRSEFARPDSLKRHQKTCLAMGEDTAEETCKVGGETLL